MIKLWDLLQKIASDKFCIENYERDFYIESDDINDFDNFSEIPQEILDSEVVEINAIRKNEFMIFTSLETLA